MTANVWINEFDYDDFSDHNIYDFVEVMGSAGTDLTGWTIYACTASGIVQTATFGAGATLGDQSNGFGTKAISIALSDVGFTEAIVLADADGNFVQALSFGGDVVLPSGVPGAGTTATKIPGGAADMSNTHSFSAQLTGQGHHYSDFTWSSGDSTSGSVNSSQSITANAPPTLTGSLSEGVAEGGSVLITAADLYFADTDNTADQISFTASNLTNGAIEVNGVIANTFTAADINNNLVSFVHDGTETTSASFDVSVDDANEDKSTSGTSNFSFTVDPVNDPAVVIGDKNGTVQELVARSVSGKLQATDVDSDPTFQIVNNVASEGGHGTVSVNAAGKWTYELNATDKAFSKLDSGETLKDHFTIQTADGTGTHITITIDGITNINGTNGDDNGTFSTIRGTAGQDYIHALKGNDLVLGVAGNDFLFGDDGNDTLYGDNKSRSLKDGDDWLQGGAGKDLLWGGGGADTFAFDDHDTGLAIKARDMIKDFSHKEGDVIDLSAIDANSMTAKDDAFKGFDSQHRALAHVGGLFIDVNAANSTIYLNTSSKTGFESAIDVVSNTLEPDDFVF